MSDPVTDVLDETPVPRASRRRKQRFPKAAALVTVLVVVVLLVVTAAYGFAKVRNHFRAAPDYSGSGTGKVVVQVKPGESAYGLAPRLVKLEVVKSAAAFRKVANGNAKAAGLQPGFYQLRLHMSAASALALLLDPAARLVGRVTVPEGRNVEQTLQILAKSSDIKLADYQAAAAKPAALGLPAYANGRLEGFLFPATYEIEPGSTAVDVLRLMVERFKQAADTVGLEQGARELGLTPYQVVIVASLIEREVKHDDEYAQVARVVYNRLQKGIPLGIDAAIAFGVGKNAGEPLTRSDLAKDTPYENRRKRGLPPTPIASPGEATLTGALNPVDGDILYYVLATKDGRSLFTSDYNAFLRQRDKSRAEGLF
jgi:UPF0755 protein